MSSAYIDNFKFTFKESPLKNTPSVEIKFTSEGFSYENGLSAKIVAEYSTFNKELNLYYPYFIESEDNDSFSQDYLEGFFYQGLKGFLCPGYDDIYVKCLKTISLGNIYMRFEFYLENPKTSNEIECFAISECQISKNNTNKNLYESAIYNTSNVYLGNFNFYYQAINGDEIYDMGEGKTMYFKYVLSKDIEWKKATLYYNDLTENDTFVEDLFNHYLVNDDGTISESINYWDFSKDITKNTSGTYCLRIKLIDTNNSETKYQSTIISCKSGRYSTNEIAYFKPVFQYNISKEFNSKYCISDVPNFSLTVPSEENNYNNLSVLMNKVTHYRYSENINEIDNAIWENFSSLDGNTQFNFYMTWLGGSGTGGEILDGEKIIVLQISDGLGNVSEIIKYDNPIDDNNQGYLDYVWTKDSIRKIYLYRQIPNSIVFNVIGSSGSEYYTGMEIDEQGRFIATNKISVNVYAQDNLNLPLEYKLYLGNSYNETEWKKFDPADVNTYYNIPFYLDSESNYGIFENNYSANVNLVFRNSAGLSSNVITKNIFYFQKMFQIVKSLGKNEKSTAPMPLYHRNST